MVQPHCREARSGRAWRMHVQGAAALTAVPDVAFRVPSLDRRSFRASSSRAWP